MRDHSAKSESKTTDRQASQLHDIQRNNVIVFNPRAISMAVRNFLRRQRWRFRPLKRLVLPARAMKRAALASIGTFFGRTMLRFEPSTLAYANTHTEISVREIHPAEVVRLPPHPFRKQTSFGELRVGPAFVFEIPNVNFWAHYGGAVVTADDALLADLSPEVWGAANHPIFSRWHLPKSRLLNSRIAIGVTPEASGNYYHWLLDLVPRVLLLKHATQNFSNYDALLLKGSRANYERETLAALGVPAEKIRYVNSRERFQIASAVFPSMETSVIAPWKVHGLRNLTSSGKPNQHRRLYLSRARAAVRRIANENEISEILRHRNFEIVEAENLSWREQADLFASGSVIVAPHGAALANIVFCQPGTRVVEISTRAGYRDWYWQLAVVAGLSYEVMEAQLSGSFSGPYENADMIVSRENFERLLKSL
jgi:capsular polysaccharide biosynthesis protein